MMALFLAVVLPGELQAVVECVSTKAIEIGARNDQPAVDVIAAANAECYGTWEQARMMQRGMAAALQYSPTARAAVATGGLTISPDVNSPTFRELVYGKAVRALMEARAKKELIK